MCVQGKVKRVKEYSLNVSLPFQYLPTVYMFSHSPLCNTSMYIHQCISMYSTKFVVICLFVALSLVLLHIQMANNIDKLLSLLANSILHYLQHHHRLTIHCLVV